MPDSRTSVDLRWFTKSPNEVGIRAQPPLILPYAGVQPRIDLPLAGNAFGSAVLGRVTLGRGAMLGLFSVLRGDGHEIVAGRDLHLGVRATVHIAHDLYPATIGDGVTVGANSVVHACTVGDGCVIEAEVAILDGAVVGAGAIVTSGSIVFPRTVLPAGFVCSGAPAAPVRNVAPGELAARRESLRAAHSPGDPGAPSAGGNAAAVRGFVALTAHLAGDVRVAAEASIWFGCEIEAGAHAVDIAAGANVQDNAILRATRAPITIGAESTIGHNVNLHDCRIGAGVLIGMSTRLASGTVVEDDVFLAAGAATEAGQILRSGWLWGGRPARPLVRLDERRRAAIALAATTYRDYAADFAAAQAARR